MYQIDDFEYIYILILLPLIWICFGFTKLEKESSNVFSRPELLEILSLNRSKFKPMFKLIVLSVSLFLLVIALMNPKIGTQLETVKREGADIVFAIDVSKSMLVEDIAPNRIEKSKRLVSAILNQLASDRVGIIAYAAQAVPQLPITTDYGLQRCFYKG